MPLRLTRPPGADVEPLEVRTPYAGGDADDAEDEEVGTTFHVAEHLANQRGSHHDGPDAHHSGDSTPPTEVATPPDARDLTDPLELRSANGPHDPGGGIDQPLKGSRGP